MNKGFPRLNAANPNFFEGPRPAVCEQLQARNLGWAIVRVVASHSRKPHSMTAFRCYAGETFAGTEHRPKKLVQHAVPRRLDTCPLCGGGVQDFHMRGFTQALGLLA